MKIKFSFLATLVILILIYWIWWIPGPRVATDFSLVSQSSLKSQMELPQVWSVKGTEGLGEYTVFTLWSYPFSLLNGLFANLGFSFNILERILILFPFLIIGIFSIWKYGEYLKLSNHAKFISTLFYLANTYILLLIDGGQLTIGLAYAFFPLTFLTIEKSLTNGIKKKILAAFLVSIIGVFDVRFILILILLCLIRFVFEFLFLSPRQWMGWIKNWVKTTLTILLIYTGLNFYWLLVLFKAPLSESTFTNLTQTSFVSLISLGHTILLLSPHWFKNVFGNITPLRFEFFLIPILVFLAPILKPNNRIVAFWLLVAIISIFLTKGSSDPFSNVYPWLYLNVPGFSLFRDSSKFFFLVALSYVVLIGITTDEIIKRFNKFKGVKVAFTILLSIYLIFLVRPVWLGNMTGTFSNPPLQRDYLQLDNILLKDGQSVNIFWIPTIAPLTALNQSHPSVEAARFVQKRPFAQASIGTYEVFNFLREASYMGQLFDVSNVGYIAYPPLNPRRDEMKLDHINYYNIFLSQLSKLDWLSRVKESEIPLFKVKETQDKLFISPNIWWVLGSDNIYKEATKSSKLKLSKNALIFSEESRDLNQRIDEIPFANIVLYNKNLLDLAASFINKNDLIFPARNLNHDPDSSYWWKRDTSEFAIWKDFLKTKYGIENQDFDLGGGWAVSEGNLKLSIHNEKFKKGNILLARVLESTRSGEISFYQQDKLIGKINTKNKVDNVKWYEVGVLQENDYLTIKTRGEINVVNVLTSIISSKLQQYKDKAESYKNRILNFEETNTKENSAKLTFKQLSPTKYIITISGLNKPVMLIFAQNYDNRWKLNNIPPMPVYSLLNGFKIEKDGQYELNFEPQKYMLTGLIISLLTLSISLFLLLV